MPPSEVYWPMITSRKNTGRPPPNRKMKYGMRNAPAEREEWVRLRLAQASTFSVPNPPSQPAGRLCPWDSSGKNARVGFLFLLQGIFLTQESNWSFLHCRQILYQLSYQGSPATLYIAVLCLCGYVSLGFTQQEHHVLESAFRC